MAGFLRAHARVRCALHVSLCAGAPRACLASQAFAPFSRFLGGDAPAVKRGEYAPGALAVARRAPDDGRRERRREPQRWASCQEQGWGSGRLVQGPRLFKYRVASCRCRGNLEACGLV